ncbi:MAG TPA: alpha/beta hydrolase [Gaiellaceae bacterium]|jgi:pimeloyl-ACP methyl ester carboxylesterase|nr:alpha/beta hydrolase [Gaiellaceae bacterium]
MPYAEVDGARLYYERGGRGAPELLFVPGWCCDRTAFQPQVDHFSRDHAVTALDLRGCGLSDCPDDGYTIPDLADDLAQFCRGAGIDRPVIVGHSLGGMIAVELAARHPAVASALVLVDPGPIDPLPETIELFRALRDALEGPDGEDVRRLYTQRMGARDEELARWIVELMGKVPLPVAAAVVRGVAEWNGVGAFSLCTLPVLLLRSELDEQPDAVRLRALRPDLHVGITVGAGHFHQLEVPEQVNAMIERFLVVSA